MCHDRKEQFWCHQRSDTGYYGGGGLGLILVIVLVLVLLGRF